MADEEPPVSTSRKGKKQSRKSVHLSKKKHRGSDDSFTEEELSDNREDKRKKHSKKSKHKGRSRKKSVTSSSLSGTESDSDSRKKHSRKSKHKGHSRKQSSTSSSSLCTEYDSDSGICKVISKKKKKSTPAVKSAPKLSYDENEDWDIFQDKFSDCAEQMDWTPSECKACLKWCLRGKASMFCSSLLKTNEDLTYKQLLVRLSDRFGDVDSNAASRAKLDSASQKKDESLEDWVDRVQELAAKAFKKLPEAFCTEEAVQKFCEGIYDGEAGHNVIMQEPKTLEQAVKRDRLFQYTKLACTKQKTGRGHLTRVTAEDYEEVHEVCAVAEKSDMSSISKQMEIQTQLLIKLLSYRSRPKGSGPRQEPIDDSTIRCYHCHEQGHRIRNCEQHKQWLKDLNKPGASPGAATCTQKKGGPGQEEK